MSVFCCFPRLDFSLRSPFSLLSSFYRRRVPINACILLSCNTYPAIMIGSLTIIDMYAHNLYGDLYENVSFDNWWCYVRFYFLLVGFCSIYLSYLLQACFHLFRVVFYKYKKLRSIRFIFRLVLLQWLSQLPSDAPGLPSQSFRISP